MITHESDMTLMIIVIVIIKILLRNASTVQQLEL